MKNKTILLSALFVGFITMEKVNADTSLCPQTINADQFQKLKKEGELENCTLAAAHVKFTMSGTDTANFAPEFAKRYKEDMCPYRLNQPNPTTYAQFVLHCPKGG